jgi:pilus assembly protein CpaC
MNYFPRFMKSSVALATLLQWGPQPLSAQAPAVLAAAIAPPTVTSGVAGTSLSGGGALQSGGELVHISVGHSVVLTAAAPLRKIYVGNPAVLQSYTSGAQELVLTAKTAGISSLLVWNANGGHQLYTVSADLDLAALQTSLNETFPGSSVVASATGNGKIVLSGVTPNDAAADMAVHMAGLYSKDVVNSLRTQAPHAKQVELKVRIVEVDRSKLEQLGFNFFTSGANTSVLGTQQFGTTTVTPLPSGGGLISLTNPLNLLFFNSSVGTGVNIDALEQKQVLQVLAEPTLTTLSGEAARFLSGGEFPVPVVQGGTGNSTAVTIIYRPYGVKVDFTPTVNPDGSIRLKVAPEVSALDYTNSVTLSGFTIPALSTRRAETEIEIKDGQSFAVSGLLDHRVTDSLNKVPALGDLPVLGELFRSKSLQHSVIELVVLVTARIVDPLTRPEIPVEPKLVDPNFDPHRFDTTARKQFHIATPPPASQEAPKDEQPAPPSTAPAPIPAPSAQGGPAE